MWVKEWDGVSLKEALFVGLIFLTSIKLVKEGISLFIELHGVLRVDILVVEVECGISESDMNFLLCFKINRRLMSTDTFSLMKISLKRVNGVGILWSILEALKEERNSRSLSSWIFVRFRIIILELMRMAVVLAVGGAEKRFSNWLSWVSLHTLDLFIDSLFLGLFFLFGHLFSSWLDSADVLIWLHRIKLVFRLNLFFIDQSSLIN